MAFDARIDIPALSALLDSQNQAEIEINDLIAAVEDLTRRLVALEAPSPTPLPVPDPVPADYPEEFRRKAVEYGVRHGEALLANDNWDKQVANIYYDADWVFRQLHEMTDDDRFRRYSDRAYDIYMAYSAQGPAAYYVFTDGLLWRAQRGDIAARNRILHLGTHGPYIPEATPLEWSAGENRSREVAYALRTLRHSRLLGAQKHPKHEALLDQSLGHVSEWIDRGTSGNFAPFMFGLTGLELLRQVDLFPDRKTDIHNWVTAGMHHCNRVAWRTDQAWCYRIDHPNAHLGTPDLNQLVVPVLQRVANITSSSELKSQALSAFQKGISSGYYAGAKQFNQLHCHVFDYLQNRG